MHVVPKLCVCVDVCVCKCVTCDAVVGLGLVVLDALLGAADGVGQQGVDAGVLTELGREPSTAGGARLLALAQPALEAGQAEVVLAWALQEQHGTRTELEYSKGLVAVGCVGVGVGVCGGNIHGMPAHDRNV